MKKVRRRTGGRFVNVNDKEDGPCKKGKRFGSGSIVEVYRPVYTGKKLLRKRLRSLIGSAIRK